MDERFLIIWSKIVYQIFSDCTHWVPEGAQCVYGLTRMFRCMLGFRQSDMRSEVVDFCEVDRVLTFVLLGEHHRIDAEIIQHIHGDQFSLVEV